MPSTQLNKSIAFISEHFSYAVARTFPVHGFENCTLQGLKDLPKGTKLVRGRLWPYFKVLSNPPLSVLSYHISLFIPIIEHGAQLPIFLCVYVSGVSVSAFSTRLCVPEDSAPVSWAPLGILSA